jgi:hypothetical protein
MLRGLTQKTAMFCLQAAFMCFACNAKPTKTFAVDNSELLVFVTEMESGYYAVSPGSLNKTDYISHFKV